MKRVNTVSVGVGCAKARLSGAGAELNRHAAVGRPGWRVTRRRKATAEAVGRGDRRAGSDTASGPRVAVAIATVLGVVPPALISGDHPYPQVDTRAQVVPDIVGPAIGRKTARRALAETVGLPADIRCRIAAAETDGAATEADETATAHLVPASEANTKRQAVVPSPLPCPAPAPKAVRAARPETGHLPALRPARVDRMGHPAAGGTDRGPHEPVQVDNRPEIKAIGDAAGSGRQGRGALALARQRTPAAIQAVDDLRVGDPLLQSALLQLQGPVAQQVRLIRPRPRGPPRRDDGPEPCDGEARPHKALARLAPAATDGGVAPEGAGETARPRTAHLRPETSALLTTVAPRVPGPPLGVVAGATVIPRAPAATPAPCVRPTGPGALPRA